MQVPQNYAQPLGQSYQPAPNILQALQQMAQTRKQQGSQVMGESPIQSNQNTLQPIKQDNPNSQIQDIAALSKSSGYDPNTMFGYNLGGSGAGSAPVIPSGNAGVGDALSLFGGSGSAAPAAGAATSAASGAASSSLMDGLWTALWSMI